MSEHHHHQVSGNNLFITILLNILITLSQVIGGLYSGSLALLSDALHNLSDVIALVIAYVANRLSKRAGSASKTFGYKRAEILAALFNALILVFIAVFLIVESVQKFLHPEVIDYLWVIALGLFSIILNAASVLLIKDDAHNNMNMRAAYLHLLTDVMTSVGVVFGGVMMYYFELYWIDPVVSMMIALYLIRASLGLIKESTAILMQFAPENIDLDAVLESIKEESGIAGVHHLHIWRLDDHNIHLEAHLDFKENLNLENVAEVLIGLEKVLHDTYNIEHTTFQCEYNSHHNRDVIAY